MFFFIGGVQPRTVTLDETPRLCPACGLAQARLRRIDHYLSLFFIPLIPVKRGAPILECQRCGAVSPPDSTPGAYRVETRAGKCLRCGSALEPGFRFCPYCGSRT